MRKDLNQWWRKAVIYQVYPRSFNDTNKDGIGDITGIIDRIDYLRNLGVDAIWISPFYPSPQVDAGYDVADYFDINPEYGSLEDTKELITRAHEAGIKVIIDVVPNHSSSEHVWFQEALRAGHDSPERARYIFRHSIGQPPNNWGSMFGGSAWSPVEPLTGKAEDQDWWYLHLFAPEQPDFDWNNSDVHNIFLDYFRFWCNLGVDGFRVDVAHGLVKQAGLPDDEVGPDRWGSGKREADELDSGPMFDQDGVHDIYREWRNVLNEYGPDRMMVAEAWVDPPARGALYVREEEMSQAFNFDYLKCGWRPERLRHIIDQTLREMGNVGAPVTWVLSNHDVVRHTSRFGFDPGHSTEGGIGIGDPQPDRDLGLQRGLSMTLFTLGLPGSAYIYQGEELGLPEVTDMPDDARQDPTWLRTGHRVRGRDGCRVPLPWKSDPQDTGFGVHPWLPQPTDWHRFSVQAQEQDPSSVLNMYRKMIGLRRQYDLGAGDFSWIQNTNSELLLGQNGPIILALNMGDKPAVIQGKFSVIVSTGRYRLQSDTCEIDANSAVWLTQQ
ncbi:glycoside hydrolase family 13 protein [Arcanobacterium phocae]|uniref:glycoside hydrolase family 13 protein n=1 Tax=Arcanobacterium phocae TaxID=131112 RepID=UPI001C0ECCD7|nr:glycoside hydrolase family 13 protein [Arcanobacterium phocae]